MEIKPEEQEVLDCWNAQAKIGGFRPHRSLLPDAKYAIRQIIKQGWKYDHIKGAIQNFALVLSDEKFYFKFNKWTLAEFLSRGKKDDKGARWLWFCPEYFNPERWYTKEVKTKITTQRELELDREKRRLQSGRQLDIAQNAVKPIPAPENRKPLIQAQINTLLKDAKTVPVNKPYIPLPEPERQRRLENMKKQLALKD